MKSPKRMPVYAMMLTALALAVQVPMNAAAQPQVFNDAATNIYTKEFYGEQCDPAECAGHPGGPDDIDVEVKASTNPLCVYVYIHISQTVAVYVYPPGIWVKRTITKTIESETCIYAKNMQLIDYAVTPNFMDALSVATFSGASDGLTQSLLRFSALDAEGQQIGQFTLASL